MAGISRGECSGSSCCELDALRGDAKRHGRRRLATEARPREQAGRNMATPQRSPLWPLVAYGALALAMLAMSERPIDAKERQDPRRATTNSGAHNKARLISLSGKRQIAFRASPAYCVARALAASTEP